MLTLLAIANLVAGKYKGNLKSEQERTQVPTPFFSSVIQSEAKNLTKMVSVDYRI